jgi:hypothetical protein
MAAGLQRNGRPRGSLRSLPNSCDVSLNEVNEINGQDLLVPPILINDKIVDTQVLDEATVVSDDDIDANACDRGLELEAFLCRNLR